MFKITINDNEIDVYDSNLIVLNKLLYDIENSTNRALQFSNAFFLPRTRNNVETFNLLSADVFNQEFGGKRG